MKRPDGFVQAYNAQIAVEPDFQLIVGQTVTQAPNDKQQIVPMVEKIEEQSGQKPDGVLADSGYNSEPNLKHLAEKQIEGFMATERQKHRRGGRERPRAASEERHAGRPDEAETADPGGEGDLCGAQRDCGTGLRADQAGARVPAVSVARAGQSAG